jgi:hypothetical protein
MRKGKDALFAVLGLVSIVLTIYFLYKTSIYLFNYFSKITLNPNIIVALIAGLVTVSGYFISRYFERKKLIEQQIREQKLPVYEEFISFIFEMIMNVKAGTETDQKEMETFMMNFTKKSIVWMSNDSLKSYSTWKKRSSEFSEGDKNYADTMKQMVLLEDMFFEFRKDIGHSNKGLKRGDLLALFINDLHKYDLDNIDPNGKW